MNQLNERDLIILKLKDISLDFLAEEGFDILHPTTSFDNVSYISKVFSERIYLWLEERNEPHQFYTPYTFKQLTQLLKRWNLRVFE